jgi:hypothetical protein
VEARTEGGVWEWSDGAKTVRAWKKWRGVRRVIEDGSWRKDLRRKEGRREITNSPFGEGPTWKGAGHMSSSKWMMKRREDHVDQRGKVDG